MKIRLPKRLRQVSSQLKLALPRLGNPNHGRLVFFFGGAEVLQPHRLDLLWKLAPFHETFEECSLWVEQQCGWSPIRLLRDHQTYPEASRFEKFVIPACLAQLGLYEVYRACGVTPEAVAGISVGEVAACYAAGAISRREAVEIDIAMAQIIASVPGRVFEIAQLSADLESQLQAQSAYLMSDKGNVKIWGVQAESIAGVRAWLNANQIPYQPLYEFLPHTPVFSHTAVVTALAQLEATKPRLPLYLSTQNGRMEHAPDADYWWRMITTADQGQTLRQVRADGYNLILDLGMMTQATGQQLPTLGKSVQVLAGMAAPTSGTIVPDDTRKTLTRHGVKLSANALRRIEVPELDIQSPRFLQDPFACYRHWRKLAPVHYLAHQNGWLVLNYDDITAILKDTEHYSSAPYREFNTQLSGNDPPDHTRVRQILTPFFTRPRMLAFGERVQQHTRQYLTRLQRKKAFDFMEEFAKPLPLAITCDFLGIRFEGCEDFRVQLARSPSWELLQSGLNGNGLMAEIIATGQFNPLETVSICEFLIGAGVITVKDLLGNSIYTLLKHPDWMKAARSTPENTRALLEELLRLEPPVLTLLRQTRTPVRVGGAEIPADTLLYLAIGAANRDPDKYETPDEIILDRTGPKNLSFSVGPHYCLGVHLGRLESEIILKLLLTEVPLLRALQSLETVEFIGSPHVREIKSLQLGFTRS